MNDISLYINCVLFRSDKNNGCCGNFYSGKTNDGKVEIDNFFCLNGDILIYFLKKCLLSSPLRCM